MLIRDGHFLGRWSICSDSDLNGYVNEPTEAMIKKMDAALSGKLLYPNW